MSVAGLLHVIEVSIAQIARVGSAILVDRVDQKHELDMGHIPANSKASLALRLKANGGRMSDSAKSLLSQFNTAHRAVLVTAIISSTTGRNKEQQQQQLQPQQQPQQQQQQQQEKEAASTTNTKNTKNTAREKLLSKLSSQEKLLNVNGWSMGENWGPILIVVKLKDFSAWEIALGSMGKKKGTKVMSYCGSSQDREMMQSYVKPPFDPSNGDNNSANSINAQLFSERSNCHVVLGTLPKRFWLCCSTVFEIVLAILLRPAFFSSSSLSAPSSFLFPLFCLAPCHFSFCTSDTLYLFLFSSCLHPFLFSLLFSSSLSLLLSSLLLFLFQRTTAQ